jgi:hypothetical protein
MRGTGTAGEEGWMRLSLVPQEREYFRLFSEAAANTEKAGELLVALMNDFAEAKSISRQILEHEHSGSSIGKALEVAAPRRERLLPLGGRCCLNADERCQALQKPLPLRLFRRYRRVELRDRDLSRIRERAAKA